MQYIIDRFEGNFAIREAEEGDVVVHELGAFRIDHEETERRRARTRQKMKALWDE